MQHGHMKRRSAVQFDRLPLLAPNAIELHAVGESIFVAEAMQGRYPARLCALGLPAIAQIAQSGLHRNIVKQIANAHHSFAWHEPSNDR